MVLTCFMSYYMVGEPFRAYVSEERTAELSTLPYHVITIRAQNSEITLFLTPEQARDLADTILARLEGVAA
jgi:hypothetical protein